MSAERTCGTSGARKFFSMYYSTQIKKNAKLPNFSQRPPSVTVRKHTPPNQPQHNTQHSTPPHPSPPPLSKSSKTPKPHPHPQIPIRANKSQLPKTPRDKRRAESSRKTSIFSIYFFFSVMSLPPLLWVVVEGRISWMFCLFVWCLVFVDGWVGWSGWCWFLRIGRRGGWVGWVLKVIYCFF